MGLESRFWAKVARRGPEECWLWTASRQPSGYGQLRDGKTTLLAHRVSFGLAHGRTPVGVVRHICDVRACVNPAHLLEGTYKDNSLDAAERGRMFTKLTPGQVVEIRRLRGKVSGVRLAGRFGVTPANISCVQLGQSWDWFKPEELL